MGKGRKGIITVLDLGFSPNLNFFSTGNSSL